MHKHTVLIWQTLRKMGTTQTGAISEGTLQERAKKLLREIPWYEWPKSAAGNMLYRAVAVIASGQLSAVNHWHKKVNSRYQNEDCFDNAAYYCAAWASHKELDWYKEHV